MATFKYLIPNIFTSLSLLSALLSLNFIISEEYIISAWFIYLSMVFDFLDGKVARKLNAMSDFGSLYDTMSDFVAFGVVPGFLMYRLILININHWGAIIALIYIFAGCYRLVRFTIRLTDLSKKSSFCGLPIPMAAGVIASTMIITARTNPPFPGAHLTAGLVVFLSLLMISRVEYLTVEEKDKKSIPAKLVFIVFLISVALFFSQANIVFLVWIMLYIFYNPLRYCFTKFQNKHKRC